MTMWARVSGPGITGPWGCDSIRIESTDDVIFDPSGILTIKSPAGVAPNGREHSAGTTTYARGMWTKVRTSEHIPRKPTTDDYRCTTYLCGECRGCKMRMASV